MTFNAINKAPGVYIDEVQVPGPIAGVSTSIAAFVGPARKGPIATATFLTSWTQFIQTFGVQDDLGPYIMSPPVYVTHAVRGFFDNGGSGCYFVRAGTAKRSWLALLDRSGTAGPPAIPGQPTLVVRAQVEGAAGNQISVAVQDPPAAVNVFRVPGATGTVALTAPLPITSNVATVANAADANNFLPGDIVLFEGGGNKDRAMVTAINGSTITFAKNLANPYVSGNTIRIADLEPKQTQIRLDNIQGFEVGTSVRITQVTGTGATAVTTTETKVVRSVAPTKGFITFTDGLVNTYAMATAQPAVTIQIVGFTLVIAMPGGTSETFSNLSMDPSSARYFVKVLASKESGSKIVDVKLADPPNTTLPPKNIPRVLSATQLAGGADDDLSQVTTRNYTDAIDVLKKKDDVSILCVPDAHDNQVIQLHMIQHCEDMQDRFAVLDSDRRANLETILVQRNGDPDQGNFGLSSDRGFGALYFPWIEIANSIADGRLLVPPSGHIAGVYARTDEERGVFKAPANAQLRGVIGLQHVVTDEEQGFLNEPGINVIRSFPGSGIRVWGARTIAPKDRTQWRYINVRRLLLFIEESIQEGTQFAVFEPNNLSLWGQLKRQVTDFLTRVWRDGALFGETAEQAFRVRIDEELNPPDLRALGQLAVEVTLVATTPAEFIVFRIISDTTGKALIQE